MKKHHINVFVTKTGRFRASITEAGSPTYEVTINGVNWKAGRGREYEEEIREKILRIFTKLEKEFITMREE